MTSNRHILSSLSIQGVNVWPCFFYLRLPSFLVVMTIIGKSRDLKTKTPNTHVARIETCDRVHSGTKTDVKIC